MSELEKVTAVGTTYDASEIQVLEGLEAVRKRPGMYIGSTSASGLHHLVYEIVDNAIDEALAGYCTEITVTINPGDTITVTDNGRGIPVDIQKQTGRPALEVVYTVLHAGGKFGGGGYKVSGGLHGVGASVVNALSQWLEVQVQKDGKIYEMKFSRGGITQEMTVLGETTGTGTAVTFKPDPEMFDTLVYDYETLHTRMREQAFLNAGLRITITDARPGQEQSDSMCYEGGIREFVTWLNRNKTPLHEEVIYLAGAKGDSTAEVALQYNDSYNETLVSFANDIHTPEGGMHETGFKTALTRVLNAYGMKYGMIKEGDKVSGEDVREGITAVISVKLTEAQFEGQTKAKLGNASIRTLVDNVVSDQLSVYLEEHPVVARTILDKALTANRAREAARKARESIRRKTALGGAAMPDKLRDCNENNPELTEIYIVEGDSAGGSATQGRDSRFQAILPLWGKMLNVEKARVDKVYGNDKLQPVISVKLTEAQFEGQTKAKLGNASIRTLVDNVVSDQLSVYLEEHPVVARTILDKALTANRAREAARKARESIRRKTALGGAAMPDKLRDCNENNPELTEIYIVEGDSAGGSATQGRDSRFQAILPLWGKMLNVEKARVDKVYGNDKLQPVITALGAGIGDELDLNRLRYHKIIIMADADVDGAHIRTLLLTFFFRFMRPLIEEGYVYSAVPPLYKLTRGKQQRVAYTDEERDAISAEMRSGNPNVKIDISRFKGLGEMNPHELWETTMDPEKRTLRRITLDDAVAADATFTVLMGEKVEPRKEFIEKNAKYAVNLDY